jgi:hypothetical protein
MGLPDVMQACATTYPEPHAWQGQALETGLKFCAANDEIADALEGVRCL